jgi:hypothetical protein
MLPDHSCPGKKDEYHKTPGTGEKFLQNPGFKVFIDMGR